MKSGDSNESRYHWWTVIQVPLPEDLHHSVGHLGHCCSRRLLALSLSLLLLVSSDYWTGGSVDFSSASSILPAKRLVLCISLVLFSLALRPKVGFSCRMLLFNLSPLLIWLVDIQASSSKKFPFILNPLRFLWSGSLIPGIWCFLDLFWSFHSLLWGREASYCLFSLHCTILLS